MKSFFRKHLIQKTSQLIIVFIMFEISLKHYEQKKLF